jgi:hypothetical protein
MSGWKLTAAILGKHAGALGDKLATGLAGLDPETATQVDRDAKAAELREVALKLADAKQKNTAAQAAASELESSIARDTVSAEKLIVKFNDKQIDEATLTEFANSLEADKARLPGVKQAAADAQELFDTLQEILNTVQKSIDEFDAKARAAISGLAQAKADQQREELRQRNQQELADLRSSTGGTSTGLAALTAAATRARTEADAAKTVADFGQKPLDRQAAVDEARRIAAGGADPATESAADRLRRIAAGG